MLTIIKTDGCSNNPEKFSTTKAGEHIPCRYSMATIWAFHGIERKHTLYLGGDCIKKFCEPLNKHIKNIINFGNNRKTLLLTRTKITSRCKSMSHLRKRILEKLAVNMKYLKVRDHCHCTGKYRGATHSIFHLKFNVPDVISVAFYNGSNYDYHLKKVKSNSNSI